MLLQHLLLLLSAAAAACALLPAAAAAGQVRSTRSPQSWLWLHLGLGLMAPLSARRQNAVLQVATAGVAAGNVSLPVPVSLGGRGRRLLSNFAISIQWNPFVSLLVLAPL